MLNTVVRNAKLDKLIPNILSVDELKIFKPFLGVYQLAPAKLGISREQILFVSSNSFDVVGAKVFGFKVAWANRAGNQLDELDVKPDLEVKDLKQLADLIKN
jgi:2-haloacid dehalogenase